MAKGKESKPKLHQNAWTTLEQKEWLVSQKPEYLKARLAGKTRVSEFWVTVYEHWIATWPFPPLTEVEVASGLDEATRLDALKVVSKIPQRDIQRTHGH
jgi:hypothetical protein